MPFTQAIQPQFRDADEDGLIGLRGCMRYFQDIHTWYMHDIDKGNDVLPERYGAAWVYTRYRLRVFHKLDYTEPATLTTWMEPYRQPVLVKQNLLIHQHGTVAAQGKLESVVFNLVRQRPLKLTAIDFPEGMPEAIDNDIPDFLPLEKTAEGMEERYRRIVRVSDLDKSRHMTNLRYIEMFQDAHDSDFWQAFCADEVQINFLTQCREGETLSVRSRMDSNKLYMAALHEDGKLAAIAAFMKANGKV